MTKIALLFFSKIHINTEMDCVDGSKYFWILNLVAHKIFTTRLKHNYILNG